MHNSMLLIPAVFTLDHFIKNKAEDTLEYDQECRILKGHLKLKLLHNCGSVNSSFKSHPGKVRTVSSAAALALSAAYIYALKSQGKESMKYALALALGGACSNLYDRYRRGYVVDYLPAGSLVWNLSDFAIIAGAVLSLL